MIGHIISFELNYWFKKWQLYLYIAIAFGLGFLTMLVSGGAFDSTTATVSSLTWLNSPNAIIGLVLGFSTLLYFFLPAIFGSSINKDFESETHQVLYSYPFSKFQYFSGKFLSALLIAIMVYLFVGLGVFAGTLYPGMNPEMLGPTRFLPYLKAYGIYLIPNLIIYGGLIFAIVSATRNMMLGYLLVVVLIFQGDIIQFIVQDMDDKSIPAIFDPSGAQANIYYTEYWTVDEQNNNPSPTGKFIWFNRLFWLVLAMGLLSVFYRFFRLSQSPVSLFKKKHQPADIAATGKFGRPIKVDIPSLHLTNSLGSQLSDIWSFAIMHLRFILKSTAFTIFAVLGILFMILIAEFSGMILQTETLPLTSKMLEYGVTFQLFLFILTFLYSGFLLHREKDSNMDQLVDATWESTSTHLWSKFLAVVLMQGLTLLLVMVGGIAYQTYKGFYQFEIGHYLFALLGTTWLYFIPWVAFSFLIHKFIPNKYAGLIVLMILFFAIPQMRRIGIEQSQFIFNNGSGGPSPSFSALDGFGHRLKPFYTYRFYWMLASLVLLFLSQLFWRRGYVFSAKDRLAKAGRRFKSGLAMPLLLSLIAFIGMGFWMYRENNVNDRYMSSKKREESSAEFEKLYKRYEQLKQPRITDVKVNLDLVPEDRTFTAKGRFILENKTTGPIDTLVLDYTKHNYTFDFDKDLDLVKEDEDHNVSIYSFKTPLQAGEKMTLSFDIENKSNTFFRNHSGVLYNGTFLQHWLIFPSIGYNGRFDLTDDSVRKKYGLEPKERMAEPTDLTARGNNYISFDADWIDFEATVSTAPDQIAIAPGYLQREWEENGRKYFHYKMDSKMLLFYSFVSGKYEVLKDKWKDVNLEIYYHKDHDFNLERMMNSLKKSLTYYTENFGPYQHRQARIIEFPSHYGSFAQAFANTIPFSEGSGFIAKIDDSEEGGVDYPFSGTAHELAHQWWAHQVIGANVQGATLMSESLSEYSSLKVLEKEYGKGKMRIFLKDALDKYLLQRTTERKKEKPLMYNENQPYIHYYKGSLVLYAMSDYLGEDKFNSVIRRYRDSVAFQEPPYTTSLEFVGMIDEATPDSLKYLIKDMFETITLYSNRVKKSISAKQADGTYKVTLDYEVRKYKANEKGKRIYHDEGGTPFYQVNEKQDSIKSFPLNDYIDIGVFGEDDKELYLQKHKVNKIFDRVEIIVNEEPKEVGIDPYNKLIDTQSSDNRRKL